MKIKTIQINLALSACVATLLSYAFSIFIFDLTTYTLSAILLTIFCAVLYPFCSRLTQTDIGFVKGMLILPLILTFAVGFSEVVYYRKMDQLIMEEAPVVILYYDQVLRFVQKNIEGLGSDPMNLLTLKRVRKL